MADKKISELVELTSLATDDVFPVVDAGANATKRITAANLSKFPAGVTVPDGGTIGSASDPDAMSIASGGDVTFSQDIIASGSLFLGGTAAANALDDYEEGTWTPTFNGTSTSASGIYIKVGNVVHWWLHVLTSSSSGASTAEWTLPFTATASGASEAAGRAIGNTSWNTFAASNQLGVLTSVGLPNNKLTLRNGSTALNLSNVNGVRLFASGSFTTI